MAILGVSGAGKRAFTSFTQTASRGRFSAARDSIGAGDGDWRWDRRRGDLAWTSKVLAPGEAEAAGAAIGSRKAASRWFRSESAVIAGGSDLNNR